MMKKCGQVDRERLVAFDVRVTGLENWFESLEFFRNIRLIKSPILVVWRPFSFMFIKGKPQNSAWEQALSNSA